jgi:predicted MPP superfamily phosphohydrolase
VDRPDKIDLCLTTVRQIKAKYGVWAVLGNWDHWMDKPQELVQKLRQAGIGVLVNQHAKIDVDGTPLYLVGVDDPFTGKDRLDKALAGVPLGDQRALVILLAHSPDIFESAQQKALPLALVGHTHGGQVRLPLIGPIFTITSTMRKYSVGLFEEDGSQMYVNRGIGWSQTSLRLLCSPELTIITLQKPAPSE